MRITNHCVFGISAGGYFAVVVAVEMIVAVQWIEVIALNPNCFDSPILIENVMGLGVISAPLAPGIGCIGHQRVMAPPKITDRLEDAICITMAKGVAIVPTHPLDDALKTIAPISSSLFNLFSTRNTEVRVVSKHRTGVDEEAVVGLDSLRRNQRGGKEASPREWPFAGRRGEDSLRFSVALERRPHPLQISLGPQGA